MQNNKKMSKTALTKTNEVNPCAHEGSAVPVSNNTPVVLPVVKSGTTLDVCLRFLFFGNNLITSRWDYVRFTTCSIHLRLSNHM